MRENARIYRYTLAEAAKEVRSRPEFSHLHSMATYVVHVCFQRQWIERPWYDYDGIEGVGWHYGPPHHWEFLVRQSFGVRCKICNVIFYRPIGDICGFCSSELRIPIDKWFDNTDGRALVKFFDRIRRKPSLLKEHSLRSKQAWGSAAGHKGSSNPKHRDWVRQAREYARGRTLTHGWYL